MALLVHRERKEVHPVHDDEGIDIGARRRLETAEDRRSAA
jgi:hypothetical protein